MAEQDVLSNQKLILDNQANILANQETIKTNQLAILANQDVIKPISKAWTSFYRNLGNLVRLRP